MLKTVAFFGFFAFVGLSIVSCSKGNPKNTDLLGDKYKKFIVGKWRQVADTSAYFNNNVLIHESKSGTSEEFTIYANDATVMQYSGAVLNFTGTYKVTKDSVIIYTPAVSGGGATVSAGAIPMHIKSFTETDLVLDNDITAEVTVNGAKQVARTKQITYFKKQ